MFSNSDPQKIELFKNRRELSNTFSFARSDAKIQDNAVSRKSCLSSPSALAISRVAGGLRVQDIRGGVQKAIPKIFKHLDSDGDGLLSADKVTDGIGLLGFELPDPSLAPSKLSLIFERIGEKGNVDINTFEKIVKGVYEEKQQERFRMQRKSVTQMKLDFNIRPDVDVSVRVYDFGQSAVGSQIVGTFQETDVPLSNLVTFLHKLPVNADNTLNYVRWVDVVGINREVLELLATIYALPTTTLAATERNIRIKSSTTFKWSDPFTKDSLDNKTHPTDHDKTSTATSTTQNTNKAYQFIMHVLELQNLPCKSGELLKNKKLLRKFPLSLKTFPVQLVVPNDSLLLTIRPRMPEETQTCRRQNMIGGRFSLDNVWSQIIEGLKPTHSGSSPYRNFSAPKLAINLMQMVLEVSFEVTDRLQIYRKLLSDAVREADHSYQFILTNHLEEVLKVAARNVEAGVPGLKKVVKVQEKMDGNTSELKGLYLSLRDCASELTQLTELAEKLRTEYRTQQEVRTGHTLYILTLVTTTFMPLDLFTDVYGMDFPNMPELTLEYGYLYFWILMAIFVSMIICFFLRRKRRKNF